jgi:hypothetical protein
LGPRDANPHFEAREGMVGAFALGNEVKIRP